MILIISSLRVSIGSRDRFDLGIQADPSLTFDIGGANNFVDCLNFEVFNM